MEESAARIDGEANRILKINENNEFDFKTSDSDKQNDTEVKDQKDIDSKYLNSRGQMNQDAEMSILKKGNDFNIENNNYYKQSDGDDNEQKDIDSYNQLNSALSNKIPDSQTNESFSTAAADGIDIRDRPTSLSLESVLEYTSKIKSFLGLRNDSDDIELHIPLDSNKERLPSSLDSDQTNEDETISPRLPNSLNPDKTIEWEKIPPRLLNNVEIDDTNGGEKMAYRLPNILDADKTNEGEKTPPKLSSDLDQNKTNEDEETPPSLPNSPYPSELNKNEMIPLQSNLDPSETNEDEDTPPSLPNSPYPFKTNNSEKIPPKLPVSLDPDEANESERIQDSAEVNEVNIPDDGLEHNATEDISKINQEMVNLSQEEYSDSDNQVNMNTESETSNTLQNALFPDVVNTTECSENNSCDSNSPDNVKVITNDSLPILENEIPAAVSDTYNAVLVEQKPNDLNSREENAQNGRDLTDSEVEFLADIVVILNQDQQIDLAPFEDIQEKTVPNVTDDEMGENEDSFIPLETFDSSQPSTSKEDFTSPFKRGTLKAQDNFDLSETVPSTESQNSEMGESYQVIHIEQGLRKLEKALEATKDNEESNKHKDDEIDKTVRNDPEVEKSESKQNMEDIRRLSCEVVNFVLQSAGEEVQSILRDRNSIPDTDTESSSKQTSTKELSDIKLHDKDVNSKNLNVFSEDSHEKSGSREFVPNIKDTFEMENIIKDTKCEQLLGEEESYSNLECGFGAFRPRWIQSFATPKTYLVLYSIIGILHGSYYTYLVGVLSTLEKRYSFKSKTSGLIMTLDELTPLFVGVFVGHFANRVHRPRLVSVGMFLSAFCCFASALPYFLYGTATHLTSTASHLTLELVNNKSTVEMCDSEPRTELCNTDDRPPTLTAIILLMLGSFLKGFGNLAYYAIGLAYLDDNSKKKNTPLYFACAYALRLFGPMAGFLMSSAFLKYYENPFDDPGFGPEDPRWIGGWWMGFVLQGILLMIFSGPLAFFPRSLPGHKLVATTTSSLFDVSDLLGTLKRLAKNKLYLLLTLNTIWIIYGNFGYYIMSPKYMENQFRLTASNASLFAGPPGIAAFMVSTVIGGYLIWRFKPTAKFLVGGLVCLEIISTLGYLLLMIPQCDTVEMTNFGYGEDSLTLDGRCNRDCNCSTVSFTPVCGPDGSSYFSPCYAGCGSFSNQTYSECSCLDGPVKEVTKGICFSETCASQALAYIITLPVLHFVINILRVASTMILLRSIRPEDKNMALGVFEAVLSTVAFIPFPILYGTLVDSTCLVWEKSCGETGNCWFYDIQRFNYFIHGASALFCGFSIFTLLGIYFQIHKVGDLYEEEGDNSNKKDLEKIKRDVVDSIKL